MRRLMPRSGVEPTDGCETWLGLFVDTETTGLDAHGTRSQSWRWYVLTYGIDGRIFRIGEAFKKLRQPSRPTWT